MQYTQLAVNKSVFRAYDIRGIVDDHCFGEDQFYSIGKSISYRLHELERKTIYLGRDGRLTSFSLAKALRHAFIDSGIDVIDLGEIPTPVLYFATFSGNIDCGIIVTGSHNPAEYNGIKMVIAGTTLANQDIERLYTYNQQGKSIVGQGSLEVKNILPEYIDKIVSAIKLKRHFKVVVDCGNGISGINAPQTLEALGCEVIPLYCEVDGRFPNHHPDPTIEENLIDLKNAIQEHNADLGLAFDGDGDRLGVVTDTGELIWPDRLMMLYSQHLLKKVPGATIVFDVKCSKNLAEVIKQSGGKPHMCPTGHSLVKAVMKKEQAALAGEMSGHLFFKEGWFGFDDALYSACRLLENLSASEASVSEQFAAIPNSISTPEIKLYLPEEIKFTFMEKFLALADFPQAEIITIDGIRVEYAHGWGLIRASNTTPCLVLRFEAEDQEALEEIQGVFREQLVRVDASLEIPF